MERTELCITHRPIKPSEVVGQDALVKSLTQAVKNKKVPHAILLTGPSGCGKTTLARIISEKALKCHKQDLREVNSSNFRGIDTVREIQSRVGLMPLKGDVKVYIIDECHMMTKDAQNAILKLLEDMPAHSYFLLLTTEPEKLLPTIRTRCDEMKVKSLSSSDLCELVKSVVKKEKKKMPSSVVDKIAECSEGSARKALVYLNSIIDMTDEDAMLDRVQESSKQKLGKDLAYMLVYKKVNWDIISKFLQEESGVKEDPETIRRIILGFARGAMLKGGKFANRGFEVFECFQENYYDTGWSGLVASCFQVYLGTK